METCTHPGERERKKEKERSGDTLYTSLNVSRKIKSVHPVLHASTQMNPERNCVKYQKNFINIAHSVQMTNHSLIQSLRNILIIVNTHVKRAFVCMRGRTCVQAYVCMFVCVCVGGGAVCFLLLIGHVLKQTDIFTAGRVWNQDEHNTAVGYRGRRNYGPFCCSSVSTFKPSLAGKTSAILIYAMSRFIQPPTPTPPLPTPAFVFFSSNTKRCCVSLTANQTSSRDFGLTR